MFLIHSDIYKTGIKRLECVESNTKQDISWYILLIFTIITSLRDRSCAWIGEWIMCSVCSDSIVWISIHETYIILE